jgi:homoserine dehydrogenase
MGQHVAASRSAPSLKEKETVRLGIAGLGTVGCGVVNLLKGNGAEIALKCGKQLKVAAVAARDKTKQRPISLNGAGWHDDARALAADSAIDIFVELIGGGEGAALESVEIALESGKHVVTANKALLARHGVKLAALAERNGAALNFEAAVAGGIPIVKTMRESLLGNRITRIYGILNGTTNYILTRMQREGLEFEDVLADAQAAGYAEADPTFDIDGQDAAHKLALLASLAFGVEPSFDAIYLEGIRSITPADFEAADELGYRIKLLAAAVQTESGIESRVSPTMIPKHSTLAGVDGVLNCVAAEGDFSGLIMLAGPGAGAGPTASSVVSDVIDIARGHVSPAFIRPTAKLKPHARATIRAHEGGYYIRLSVYDRPGAFAAIATRMAEQSISLESIVQKRPALEQPGMGAHGKQGDPTPVVMITHQTTESHVRHALEAIVRDGHVDAPPQMIRIESL